MHDPVFPEGEIEWMKQQTRGNPDVHILVSPWISHAFAGEPATRWQRFEVINFTEKMLYRAAHRVSLKQ